MGVGPVSAAEKAPDSTAVPGTEGVSAGAGKHHPRKSSGRCIGSVFNDFTHGGGEMPRNLGDIRAEQTQLRTRVGQLVDEAREIDIKLEIDGADAGLEERKAADDLGVALLEPRELDSERASSQTIGLPHVAMWWTRPAIRTRSAVGLPHGRLQADARAVTERLAI